MNYLNYILLLCVTFLFTRGNIRNDYGINPENNHETIHYKVRYGLFTIGEALILSRVDSLGGINYIKAEARSTGLVNILLRINYVYESYVDPRTGLPIDFSMKLEDNRNYYYNKLLFDRHSRKDSAIVHSYLSGPHVVTKDIHDILTGFFLFRQKYIPESVKRRRDIVIKTFFIDELWDLRIRYAGQESIHTQFGEVNCLKFKPVTVVGDFFRKDDDMTVWFSDDPNHFPVRIKLDLTIGSIDGYLVDYY